MKKGVAVVLSIIHSAVLLHLSVYWCGGFVCASQMVISFASCQVFLCDISSQPSNTFFDILSSMKEIRWFENTPVYISKFMDGPSYICCVRGIVDYLDDCYEEFV